MNCLKQLEYVIEVARCQSITKAAKKLFMTSPALRDSINSLETELGFPIFFRSNRGVILTASGEHFLQDIEKMLAIAEVWKNDSAITKVPVENQVQTVHIRISLSIADYIFQKAFLKLFERYPNLSLNLDYCSTPEMFAKIGEKTVPDIFIIGAVDYKIDGLLRFAEEHQYDIETLMTPLSGVIVREGHPLMKKAVVSLKDLKKYDIAILNSSGEDAVMELLSSYAKQVTLITNNKNDILELVATSDVISWLSYFTVHDSILATAQKIAFLPVESLPATSYYIMYPCREKLTASVKCVVNYIKDFFEKQQ